nr:MAG TPA: hypothetical protein [Caudoviricetes sp.]
MEYPFFICNAGEASRIKASESKYYRKPTKTLLRETQRLLKDFRISVSIPKFETAGELLRWRKSVLTA